MDPAPASSVSTTSDPASPETLGSLGQGTRGINTADELGGYESTGTFPYCISGDEFSMGDSELSALEFEFAAAAKAVNTPVAASDSTAVSVGTATTAPKSSQRKGATAVGVKRATSSRSSAQRPKATSPPNLQLRSLLEKKLRYPEVAESSGRLGGIILAVMRDSMKKRTYAKFDEASYAKKKSIRAEKAAAQLKRNLAEATQGSTDSSAELVKTGMALRADTDRADRARVEAAKAKRQAERDACEKHRRIERREERDATEECRRQEYREEREAAVERRGADRQGPRGQMREMLMRMSALQNGKIPSMEL